MQKKIIIRDDDTSFYTTPNHLEAVYGRLWAAGMPVCLAVVPNVAADVQVMDREGQPFDPGIPVGYRGRAGTFPLTENPEMCHFLNDLAREGLVEICHHGYMHTHNEFLTPDVEKIMQKLTDGYGILKDALPDATIRTFIAPYDQISRPALQAIFDFGYDVCSLTESLTGILETGRMCQYTTHQSRQVFACDEYLFTHRDDPDGGLQIARRYLESEDLLIITNHYWMFFYDWQSQGNALMTSWQTFVDDLLATGIMPTTFASSHQSSAPL